MTRILLTTLGAITFCSCTSVFKGNHGSVVLPNVHPVSGRHCESSALLNALRYQGYEVSEAMIIGGGGALSFAFIKGIFPFIAARNTAMREAFCNAVGIPLGVQKGDSKRYGWDKIDWLLREGKPVLLRVDMRYLPYRYNGKYGLSYMSFGWHVITLFGLDYDRGVAFVTDTEYSGLQTISLTALHKARNSRTKNYPPHGEFAWLEDAPYRPFHPDPSRLVSESFSTLVSNYESGALAALEAFPQDLRDFETYSGKQFLYPDIFEYLSATIEDNGTGGASFRMLYREFLEYAASSPLHAELCPSLIKKIDESIALWHELSAKFREESTSIKGMNAGERERVLAELAQIAQRLALAEKAFYTELKQHDGE